MGGALPALINSGGYGLTFGVHSRVEATVDRFCREVEAGNIYVNRNIIGAMVGVQPFGGRGLSGTGPKAGGPYYLERLVQRAKRGDAQSMPVLSAHGPSVETGQLLHGEEERVWGDAGYTGVEKRPEHQQREVSWMIAMKRGQRQQLDEDSTEELIEQLLASTRAIVEHPFRYIKRVFGYDKVRYRGLAKNSERLHLLAGFTNLWIAKKTLLA